MIYLASKSPRRRQLLELFGIDFETLVVAVNEHWNGTEAAPAYVCRLALEKARAGSELVGKDCPVLAADTEVLIDAEILGKPADRVAALTMLQRLSGRSHQVLTAVALVQRTETVILSASVVTFKPLNSAECEAYCDSGEPYDKAGGYAIQGLAAAFVTRLEGSYTGVMGLPQYETAQLLRKVPPGLFRVR